MRMIPIFALAALAATGGCSSSSDGDNNNSTACTVKLTGAITSTSACTVSATFARNRLGVSDFSILKTGDPGFDLGFSADGQLASATYTQAGSGVSLAVTTASSGGLLWSETASDPAHGSMSVTLTSVSLGSDGYTFTVHGTADATLTATPGATGTVTAHVDF